MVSFQLSGILKWHMQREGNSDLKIRLELFLHSGEAAGSTLGWKLLFQENPIIVLLVIKGPAPCLVEGGGWNYEWWRWISSQYFRQPGWWISSNPSRKFPGQSLLFFMHHARQKQKWLLEKNQLYWINFYPQHKEMRWHQNLLQAINIFIINRKWWKPHLFTDISGNFNVLTDKDVLFKSIFNIFTALSSE